MRIEMNEDVSLMLSKAYQAHIPPFEAALGRILAA